MVTTLKSPVEYQLPINGELIALNPLIGQPVSLTYQGEIHCIECGRKTKKSYNQGYCYPCFKSLAACDLCIMKPETCHHHMGSCRQPQWGESHCFQDHTVYLANSSGVKVGITRGTQIPTRWIDQGAIQALPIFRVSNRLISGKLEVVIKDFVSDRTDWRKMLKGVANEVDLVMRRDELLERASSGIKRIEQEYDPSDISLLPDEKPLTINYPVDVYPDKVKSFNFDKTPVIEGLLQGIKGQYLILNTGVLNIRKFAGYHIEFSDSQGVSDKSGL